MRTVPHRLGAITIAAVVVAAAATGTAAAQPHPRLVDVRAAEHPTFDRVVFEFRGGLPQRREVRYVPALVQDGSGFRLPIAGRAILRVTLSFVDAHDAAGRPTAPDRAVHPFKNVIMFRRAGDFEAVVTYGIGLARRRPVTTRVLTSPNRFVVDIPTDFRTVRRRVYFQNLPRFVEGTEPYVTPVVRRVLAVAPAAGVLDRLFAGPTLAERRRGLRLVASRATGFRDLSVAGGVARVRLTGGCDSRGSTFTVANLIDPTLVAFPNIDAVKIFSPSGQTGNPTGPGGSIPDCLNP